MSSSVLSVAVVFVQNHFLWWSKWHRLTVVWPFLISLQKCIFFLCSILHSCVSCGCGDLWLPFLFKNICCCPGQFSYLQYALTPWHFEFEFSTVVGALLHGDCVWLVYHMFCQCLFESCFLHWRPSKIVGPLLLVDVLLYVFGRHLSSVWTTNILLLLLGPLLMVSINAVYLDLVGDGACEDRYKFCRLCSMPYWTIEIIACVSIPVSYYHHWPLCTAIPPHFLYQLDKIFYNMPPCALDNPHVLDLSSSCHLHPIHVIWFPCWWPLTSKS